MTLPGNRTCNIVVGHCYNPVAFALDTKVGTSRFTDLACLHHVVSYIIPALLNDDDHGDWRLRQMTEAERAFACSDFHWAGDDASDPDLPCDECGAAQRLHPAVQS